jgi:hypothetical protein
LLDVGKALKDKDFSATAKPLQRILQSIKPLKIKHFAKILCSFAVDRENISKNPTLTPTD